MPLGFGSDGNEVRPTSNRTKSQRTEKQSATTLGARLVSGSGSSRYAKGDFLDDNATSPHGKGYCYQQKTSSGRKSGKPTVPITRELLEKTRREAAFMQRSPVLEVILEGEEPWYMVPLGTWQHLTNEKLPD